MATSEPLSVQKVKMPKIRQMPWVGYLFVLLCITRCSLSEDPDNELDMQRTHDSLSRNTDGSTILSTDQSLTSATTASNGAFSPKILDSNETESSTLNEDSSTDTPMLVPVIVTNRESVTGDLDNSNKVNISSSSVVSETVTPLSVPSSSDIETPAKEPSTQNDDSTTSANAPNTFPADSPFIALDITTAPQMTAESNAPKQLTSSSSNMHGSSLADAEPHVVNLVTNVPLITDLVHELPLAMANISPEIDIFDSTTDPTTQEDKSPLDDQPQSHHDQMTSPKDVAPEITSASESGARVQTQASTAQESRSHTTSENIDHSTAVLTSNINTEPNEDQSSPDEEPTMAPAPVEPTTPTVPLLVPDSMSSLSPLPETATAAQEEVSAVLVGQSAAFAPDDGDRSTPEDETTVDIVALHPLHGLTTVGLFLSSPVPDTQDQTDMPSIMVGPDALSNEEDTSTAGQPSFAALNLTSPDDVMEEESTSVPEVVDPPTEEDMMQEFSTVTSTIEETIISPELVPELTVPLAGANTTTDGSSADDSISVVLEDLSPTTEPNKTHKDSKDLTDDEHSNAVTVIFYVPEPRKADVEWDEDYNLLFRYFVADQLNQQQEAGWPDLFKNNGSFIDHTGDAAKRRRRQIETSVLPEDLVYISPAPLVDDRYVYVVFFVRNSSTPDPCDVVLGQKVVHALKESRLDLEQRMDMNVTRISTGIIMVKYLEPFFVRHALIFIVLLAVAFFCICLIIIGLLCIRCRNSKGNWKRNEFSDEKALKRDMKSSTTDAGDVNAGNNIENDEPQMTEKYGNGNHVISLGDDDVWVIPYDDLTPSQKAKYDFEDTKL